MTEKDELGFSWQTLFFVTGVSCMVFDLLIWMVDGFHAPELLWTGVTGFALGILSLIFQYIIGNWTKKDQ